MATPLNYTEIVHDIDERLKSIEKMVKALYDLEEFDQPTTNLKPKEKLNPEEEEIITNGQKIPYNLIDKPEEVEAFQQFLYDAKTKYRNKLYDSELEMVDYADKGFEDVRLSNRHLTVMKRVYQKLIGQPWPFTVRQGYMYKLEPYPNLWKWIT